MAFKMKGHTLPGIKQDPTKAKKSKVAVDGQLEDAQSDYGRDLKNTSNNLTKKPVGPRAKKKEIKEPKKPKVPTNYADGFKEGKTSKGFDTRNIKPGYEDPIKIQALHREGLTPGSQKFIKKVKENKENAK